MMFFKRLTRLIAAIFPLAAFSQNLISAPKNNFRNEFSLVSDNDNYTLEGRDGYYTNGFFLKWSHAADISKMKFYKNKPNVKKVINGFEIGQAIYNPISYNRPFPENQDRPFAAYLAATFDQHIFSENKSKLSSMLMWGLSVGAIGPDSYGEQVQRWYHNVIGIYDVKGWPYQVNNQWSLNLKAAYYVSPFNKNNTGDGLRKGFEGLGFLKTNLGNQLTNASAGILLRLGRIENLYNSSHFRARIGTAGGTHPRYNHELYLFYQPEFTYQVYNSVLQGAMFLRHKGPVTVDLKRAVFSQQVGLRFAKNRFTGALIYNNQTKEAIGQMRNEHFCSLQFAYRFDKL